MIIKIHHQNTIVNFNTRLKKTWNQVPQLVSPNATQVLMYYYQAFDPKFSMHINTFGATLPQVYDVAKRD